METKDILKDKLILLNNRKMMLMLKIIKGDNYAGYKNRKYTK